MNLYKYTSINKNSIENLKNNRLYMPSPLMFNDPYEFIFKLNVNDEIYVDFLKLIYRDKYLEFLERKLSKEEVLSYTRDCYFPQFCNMMGACCLTENENHDIMWAHYGGNHKGVCIEYDATKHPFNICEKVKYVNKVMSINVDNLTDFEENIPVIFNDIFVRKNTSWSYEKEWRLIYQSNSFVEYSPDAIKSITFGFFCDKKSKIEIYEATAHLEIEYYEVARAKDAYKIVKKLIKR